jgi:hypothetical protein
MLRKKTTTKSSTGEDMNKKIADKAYELFVKRGSTAGNEWGDWFEAERIVKSGKR